jgi:hypothetical protein
MSIITPPGIYTGKPAIVQLSKADILSQQIKVCRKIVSSKQLTTVTVVISGIEVKGKDDQVFHESIGWGFDGFIVPSALLLNFFQSLGDCLTLESLQLDSVHNKNVL